VKVHQKHVQCLWVVLHKYLIGHATEQTVQVMVNGTVLSLAGNII
jgi:hypothetical protein